jgi:hypothetical protein
MQNVRAKFKVIAKTDRVGEVVDIQMAAVYDGSEENKAFFKATPAGQINLGTVNKAAADAFAVGAEYYVDFTKA